METTNPSARSSMFPWSYPMIQIRSTSTPLFISEISSYRDRTTPTPDAQRPARSSTPSMPPRSEVSAGHSADATCAFRLVPRRHIDNYNTDTRHQTPDTRHERSGCSDARYPVGLCPNVLRAQRHHALAHAHAHARARRSCPTLGESLAGSYIYRLAGLLREVARQGRGSRVEQHQRRFLVALKTRSSLLQICSRFAVDACSALSS
jgi:hypothetical protein